MDYTKKSICINCGKEMKQGSSQSSGFGFTQFRYCGCGLKMIVFNLAKGKDFEFKLVNED